MATEVGDNYDSLVKEMETLKGRLEEERLKLNDVARKQVYASVNVNPLFHAVISGYCNSVNRGAEARTFGDHNHQATQSAEGSSGKGPLCRLVLGQAPHCLIFPGTMTTCSLIF